MDPGALATMLEGHRADRLIVCAQAGEVNTGAFDPLERIVETSAAFRGAWLHVDGAFGLWAAASPRLRPLIAGHEGADSWARRPQVAQRPVRLRVRVRPRRDSAPGGDGWRRVLPAGRGHDPRPL